MLVIIIFLTQKKKKKVEIEKNYDISVDDKIIAAIFRKSYEEYSFLNERKSF